MAQLAGYVAEHSSYHHGEVSLAGTIVNLAQNYVGSNNINYLMPEGQFGTRLQGMFRILLLLDTADDFTCRR